MTAALLHYRKLTPESFEELAAANESVGIPLEQSPYWADFERSLGRNPYGMWAYYNADVLVAVASFLRIQRRFRESMVVVNGPVWFCPRTPELELRLMNTVRDQFAKDSSVNPLYVRMQVQNPQPPADGPLEHGWYEREIVVDLTPDEKTIFKSFRPNARNSIRRAERSGMDIRTIDRDHRVEVFRTELFPILEETAARDGFASFESRYYEKLLTELGGYLRLMVAYVDGEAVSWLITTEYRGHAVYYFAGSTHEARKTFAPYLLLWEAFKSLKAAGGRSCGLTGIVSENYPQLINVTTFKRNFSKNVVEVPTTYDVPLNPTRYRAVAAVLQVRRAVPAAARKMLLSAASRASGLLRFRGRPRG